MYSEWAHTTGGSSNALSLDTRNREAVTAAEAPDRARLAMGALRTLHG